MKCEIVRDLLILYVDGCCSDESRAAIEEHLRCCPGCVKELEKIKERDIPVAKENVAPPRPFRRVKEWRASVLQSVLFFLSFVVLTVGVSLEASTSSSQLSNGWWAITLVVPAAGFLLSLGNWFFVRIYPNRKTFALSSLAVTAVLVASGWVWAFVHYAKRMCSPEFLPTNIAVIRAVVPALSLSLALVLSPILSLRYAKMIGKE